MALVRFLIRRILSGIVVLWLVAIAGVLPVLRQEPGHRGPQLAGRGATAAMLAEITRNLGLNQPILTQYWHFLDRTVHGNLGYSYFNREPVSTIIAQDLPRTASVAGRRRWCCGSIVGLAVGILSATRARSPCSTGRPRVGVLIGLSMPTFVLGEMLLLVVYLPLNEHGIHWIKHRLRPDQPGLRHRGWGT